MPDWVRFPLVLTIVAAISAIALAGLQHVTKPVKERIQNEITERALKVVMPTADSFEEVDATVDGEPFMYRIAKGADGQGIGYVSIGASEGYSSRISVMVGATSAFEVAAIKVIYQRETPGLGDKIKEILSKKTWWTVFTDTSPDETGLRPWFQTQFDGKKVPLKVDKDGGTIEAITGATISSRAVCDAVNIAVEKLEKAIPTQEKENTN